MPFDLEEARQFRAKKPEISDFNKGRGNITHENDVSGKAKTGVTVNIGNITINGNVTIINNDNRTATVITTKQ